MGVDVDIYLINKKTYQEKLLPAFQALSDKDDSQLLIVLLKDVIERLDKGHQSPQAAGWNREVFEEAIGILDGSIYYSTHDTSGVEHQNRTTRADKLLFATENIGSALVLETCVPQQDSPKPHQDMSNTALIQYLSERSEWIRDVFTLARPVTGGHLPVPVGDSSECFTDHEVEQFQIELNKIALPEDMSTKQEYENLRTLLEQVLRDPNLVLIYSIS